MKKIFLVILMLNAFVFPLIVLAANQPHKAFDMIEPVDVEEVCGGLESIEYRTILPEPIDISMYQSGVGDFEEAPVPLEAGPVNEDRSEIRYDFDNLKDDDFIAGPSFYGYSYELTDEERELVERAVMHEAGWCPDYRLLILTAQCFRNDCELYDWRPNETFEKCGYAEMSYVNPRTVKAVKEVFDEGVQCVPEKIFCFYNRNLVYSAYHEGNRLAIDIDGNRFFY